MRPERSPEMKEANAVASLLSPDVPMELAAETFAVLSEKAANFDDDDRDLVANYLTGILDKMGCLQNVYSEHDIRGEA